MRLECVLPCLTFALLLAGCESQEQKECQVVIDRLNVLQQEMAKAATEKDALTRFDKISRKAEENAAEAQKLTPKTAVLAGYVAEYGAVYGSLAVTAGRVLEMSKKGAPPSEEVVRALNMDLNSIQMSANRSVDQINTFCRGQH